LLATSCCIEIGTKTAASEQCKPQPCKVEKAKPEPKTAKREQNKECEKPKSKFKEFSTDMDDEEYCLNSKGSIFIAKLGSDALRALPYAPKAEITKIHDEGVEIIFYGKRTRMRYGERIGSFALTLRFEKIDGRKYVKVISGDPEEFCTYRKIEGSGEGEISARTKRE